MPLSKPIPNGAGAHAPAFALRFGKSLWLPAVIFSALAVTAWLAGSAVGERLALSRLRQVTGDLPQIEVLSRRIADTLYQQGVCLDAPRQGKSLHVDTSSRIEQLQAELAVQGSCVELAIAQQQFETLQIETATVHILHQKQLFKNGLVIDSLAYRANSRHRH